MAWNDQIPPLVLSPDIEPGNVDEITTGIPELDDAVGFLIQQAKANSDRTDENLKKISDAVGQIGAAFERYGSAINRVVNGQIEFPTPYATEHTGNIKASFVNIVTTGVNNGPAIQIRHGYGDGTQGQTPRGWIQIANASATSSARFLDQLLDGQAPAPIVSPGYVTADILSATSVTGRDLAVAYPANKWVGNDVRVGDQIKLTNSVNGLGTASVSAGSGVITGIGAANWLTEAKVGWKFRFGAGTDQGWHTIDSISSATSMTVTPSFVAANAGSVYRIYQHDRTWVDISAVTLGVGGGAGLTDALTLAGSGTEVSVANGCDYVIRRPMDSTYATLRYLGSGMTETTIMFF